MPRPSLRRTPVTFTGPPAEPAVEPDRRVRNVNERKSDLLPLPLASQVGLEPAFRQLEQLLTLEPAYRTDYAGARRQTGRNPFGGRLLLPHQLDPEDPLVAAAVQEWERHTLRWPGVGHVPRSTYALPVEDGGSPVRLAMTAARQQQTWAARRRIGDTREARKQQRHWAQVVLEHTPAAVEIVDSVAGALNAAANGGTVQADRVVMTAAPSWH